MLAAAALLATVALSAAQPEKPWNGSASLGLQAVGGNASSFSVNLAATAERRWTRWIASGRTWAAYGESQPAGADRTEVGAANAGLFLRLELRLNPRLGTYALAGLETDHVRSIEARFSQELGLSYALLDQEEGDRQLHLRTDLGFRITEEQRFQYFPVAARVEPRGNLMTAPRFAAAFRCQPQKGLALTQDLEVLPALGETRVLVNALTKLTVRMVGPLAVGFTLGVQVDSEPPPPKGSWDTTAGLTLDVLL